MKKLLLSVMIAGLYTVSYAGTIESAIGRDCEAEGVTARNCAVEMGLTQAEAEALGDCVMEKCIEETETTITPGTGSGSEGSGGGGIKLTPRLPIDPKRPLNF